MTPIPQLVASGAAGVLIHNTLFIYGEWHLHSAQVLVLHALAYAGLLVFQVFYQNISWLAALTLSSQMFGMYTLCLLASIGIYRIFFHRLRNFPGPLLASVSKLWHVAHCLDSKNHILMEKMHQEYGDFVRTGPSELTVFTPDVIPTMFEGINNKFTRPDWFDGGDRTGGLTSERDTSVHHHRRRIWDQAFTTKALRNYEVQVKAYTDQLERLIAQSEGQPVVANQYFHWFSFDVMGQVAFSKDFNMLRGAKWHFAIKVLREGMATLGPLSPAPWLMSLLSHISTASSRDFKNMVLWGFQQMDDRVEREVDTPDISQYLIEWSKKNSTLKEDMFTLRGDALSLTVAGSDTVSLTLIYIFYRLARHPEQLRKLQTELASLESISDFTALQHVQHLNGIINETMRLHPATLTGNIRETPPEGAMISGRFVPGNIVICSPRYIIGKLESCFERGKEFIPERWYSKPEMIKNKSAYAPFALGRYICVGKTLALQELRYVTALLASKYDVMFPPGEDGRSVEEDTLDQFISNPGELRVVFQARREE